MTLAEFLLWTGLVGLDVWLVNAGIPNRIKGYGSALLLGFGLRLADWGKAHTIRTDALLVVVGVAWAIHELWCWRARRNDAALSDLLEKPSAQAWSKMTTQFRKYDGDLDAYWEYFEQSGSIEWNIPRGRTNARRIQEFLTDAQRAGRMARTMGPRRLRFPVSVATLPEDYWLMVVLTEVDPMNDITSTGHSPEKGLSEGGFIKDVVHASSIACKQLANEMANQEEART